MSSKASHPAQIPLKQSNPKPFNHYNFAQDRPISRLLTSQSSYNSPVAARTFTNGFLQPIKQPTGTPQIRLETSDSSRHKVSFANNSKSVQNFTTNQELRAQTSPHVDRFDFKKSFNPYKSKNNGAYQTTLDLQMTSLKEKVSMNKFLFSSETTSMNNTTTEGFHSPKGGFYFGKGELELPPTRGSGISGQRLGTSSNHRLQTADTLNSVENDRQYFKTTLDMHKLRAPLDVMSEIREAEPLMPKIDENNKLLPANMRGFLKKSESPLKGVVTGTSNHTNSTPASRQSRPSKADFVAAFGFGMDSRKQRNEDKESKFRIKKTIVHTNAIITVNPLIDERERKRKKAEVMAAINGDKNVVMVCVLPEYFWHKEKMQFCFIEKELPRPITKQNFVREDVNFNISLHEIRKRLRLENSYRYLNTPTGESVFNLTLLSDQEPVIIISKDGIYSDAWSIIVENEFVRLFVNSWKKNEGSHVIDLDGSRIRPRAECAKDVLDIVEENEPQLTAAELNKLITIATTEGTNTAKFNDAMANAFRGTARNNETLSTVTESEDTTTQRFVRSGVKNNTEKTEPHHRFSLLDIKNEFKSISSKVQNSLERMSIVHMDIPEFGPQSSQDDAPQTELEKYVKSTKPLAENQKIKHYKKIVKEYDRGIKNVKMVENEDDNDYNAGVDQEALKEAKRARHVTEQLKIDEKLEDLLIKQFGDKAVKEDEEEDDDEKLQLIPKREKDDSRDVSDSSDGSRDSVAEELHALKALEKEENARKAEEEGENKEEEGEGEVEEKAKEPEEPKDFIESNIRVLDTKKKFLQDLMNRNTELVYKNIPKYVRETNLSRLELHSTYVLYKALCEVTSQRYKNYDANNGIDLYTFRNGIYKVAVQSEELAEKLFYAIDENFSGFLDWDEFLDVMVTLQAKTLHEKIDLFIRIADEDGNGLLSKDEIFDLAKVCLGKFIKDMTDGFLDDLCHYFTKLIFESLKYDIDDEIPLEEIRQAILSGNEESDLLAMFCGADL